ncbi:MAG TPA: malate synthase A [Nevskiaceae bacterium]|nr:malate synthase A [Nevskiaceae bacterium]
MSVGGGIEVRRQAQPGFERILTPEALNFVATLNRKYRARHAELMALRQTRQAKVDAGGTLGFLPETRKIREGDWKIAGIPADLQDRRVEITGPVDRKMIINALNAHVKCFMADFEDSQSPTWDGLIGGQSNLCDAVRRTISYTNPKTGKQYRLNDKIATLIVRPRGWHLPEKHLLIDGQPAIGAIVDFGLFFFHNAKELIARGTGPYFYLPKMQSHLEARLWNDLFNDAQDALGVPRKTIKVTVLVETLWATFEMDEILYELKDHIVGLNCGRWDYMFSYIKTFKNHADRIVPDRNSVGMARHHMDSYSKLLCMTCHRRGASAMGGMSNFIPVKNDDAWNKRVTEQVTQGKEREVRNGHDGTWIAHPGLCEIANSVFDRLMPQPNQINEPRDWKITEADLLDHPTGKITEEGLRNNITVGMQYIEAWLGGNGCVPIFNLMEDAATAEISRTQIWQWLHFGVKLEDGRPVTKRLIADIVDAELAKIRQAVGEDRYLGGRYSEAAGIMTRMSTAAECVDFLTLPAYAYLD